MQSPATADADASLAGRFPACGWVVGVFAALGAGPRGGAVRVAPDLPAGLVFDSVVAAAFRPEVLRAGVAVRERAVVIEVAGSGGSVAGREYAGALAGGHQFGEVGGGPVAGGAEVDDLPGDRGDHQPAPRAGFVRGP